MCVHIYQYVQTTFPLILLPFTLILISRSLKSFDGGISERYMCVDTMKLMHSYITIEKIATTTLMENSNTHFFFF